MRILQLGKFYPIRGGVEKVMRDLTEGLSGLGIRCDMLCAMLASAKIDEKDSGKASIQDGTTVITLNDHGRIIIVRALAKKAATMLSPAMIAYLRKHASGYDLIHIHHPDPMAALALRMSGFRGRVVVHWHSDILSQKTLLKFYKPLQNWMLRRAETIVGTSPVYLKESEHLRQFQDKCKCIPIGIAPFEYDADLAAMARQRYGFDKMIFTVGRLVPYKGLDKLITAISMLPDSFGLVIVGDGPLREALKKQSEALGLTKRIIFAGYMAEGPEFSALFGACDAFVLPSVMKTEAFGIVQIEAMCCGKPVVATRIPGSGVSWVNKDGVSGINVAPGDPEALASAIKQVCDNAAVYGRGARELFAERYTKDKMINKVLELYEQKNPI